VGRRVRRADPERSSSGGGGRRRRAREAGGRGGRGSPIGSKAAAVAGEVEARGGGWLG